ncbi:uncharacterized protein N7482_000962 [Penicillium canariense]|uniref:Cytochrome P450 n=1 Tax=Penicillium canariense TaxID=189055 RepID=A0A9W9LT47_9EURO|nr:uncharacterized protein N7482_000962 [Penicillium canariense]KAJ5175085.1 hypothetical protein N7482_000962 [Penicillium canariense]
MSLVDTLGERIAEREEQKINIFDDFDYTTSAITGKLSANFKNLDQSDDYPFWHFLRNALRMSVIAQFIPRDLSLSGLGPPRRTLIPHSQGPAGCRRIRTEACPRASLGSDLEHRRCKTRATRDSHELLGEAFTLVYRRRRSGRLGADGSNVDGRQGSIYQALTEQLRATFARYEETDFKAAVALVLWVGSVLNEPMRLNPVLPGPMWCRTDQPILLGGYALPEDTEMGVM